MESGLPNARRAPPRARGTTAALARAGAASPARAARRTRPGIRCAHRDTLLCALKPAPYCVKA